MKTAIFLLLLMTFGCTAKTVDQKEPEEKEDLKPKENEVATICPERSDILYVSPEGEQQVSEIDDFIGELASWADRAEYLWAREYGNRQDVARCLRDMIWYVRDLKTPLIGYTSCTWNDVEVKCRVYLDPYYLPPKMKQTIAHELTHVVALCGDGILDADHDDERWWAKFGEDTYMARLMREPKVICK